VLSYTIPATTWTPVSLVVPGDTTGTWVNDTGVGFSLHFTFACGGQYQATPGTWQAGNFLGASGMTNGALTTGNTFYIRNVGLYRDPLNTGTAPPFVMPDEAQERTACQRYWQAGNAKWGGYTVTGAGHYVMVYLKVPMRVVPAAAVTDTGAIGFPSVASTAADGATGSFTLSRAASGTGPGLYGDNWVASSRM
jgi:hypothetical protein